MSWKVAISHVDDRLVRRLTFWVYRDGFEGTMHVLAPDHVVHTVAADQEPDRDWAWTLPFEVAQPLVDELSAHLIGYRISDAKLLRDDLLHERGRVDRMLDHLMKETP